MRRLYQVLVYTISFLFAHACLEAGFSPVMFSGSMKFPLLLKKVPSVRVYWSGHRIACSVDEQTKTVNFSIPGLASQHGLYLVIAKDICLKSDHNVVFYLYLKKQSPYKFYYLQRKGHYDEATRRMKLGWNVKELALLEDTEGNLRLPDDAIVIYYEPKFIEGLDTLSDNPLDLPRINVVDDILSLVGSEKLLHSTSDTLLCTALTMDTIHRELDQDIRPSIDHKVISTITT